MSKLENESPLLPSALSGQSIVRVTWCVRTPPQAETPKKPRYVSPQLEVVGGGRE